MKKSMMTSRLISFGPKLAAAICFVLILAFAGLSGFAAERSVAITSCTIQGGQVVCQMSAAPVPASDDGKFYVFANEVNEDGPVGNIVGSCGAGANTSVSFPLNLGSASSNLSRKFLVAVRRGGAMVQVSDEHYITNPEAAALYAAPRRDFGKKGILPDPRKINDGTLQDLGIKQISYNINIGDIVGESTNETLPTIYFDYEGVQYAFNPAGLMQYDNVLSMYTAQGMQITLNILNRLTPGAADLVHPLARNGHSCPNYAFNTAEAGGVKHLKAIAAFLGRRYNGGNGCGQVDNWIVGNEVNARTEQYYMSSDNLEYNVSEYNKAFRIFYNGIRSENATARIYNSIDQEWGRKSNPGSFLSREYLDRFNYYILREGNIDYGLSFHPYNSPLYDPYTWHGYDVWVHTDVNTPYITMQNLFILTDYMCQPQFLNPAGQVRSISLSEIGFTSSFGDELQAASVAYGYLQAMANPFISSFLLFREVDDAHEMKSNIAQGLFRMDGTRKMAYDFYKNIDGPQAALYKQKASAIMGVNIDSLIGSRTPLVRGGWVDPVAQ